MAEVALLRQFDGFEMAMMHVDAGATPSAVAGRDGRAGRKTPE